MALPTEQPLAPVADGTAATDDSLVGHGSSFLDWLISGEAYLKFLLRGELVDQDGLSEEAYALTLRTVLGYRTASKGGFQGLIEFEDVSSVGISEGKSTVDGVRRIVDPSGTEVNQVYLDYTDLDDTLVRFGRQRIVLDNARWIGNVVWRQNEQTFDAGMVNYKGFGDSSLLYGYVQNINRITGENELTSTHLVNASYTFEEVGKAAAYLYYLDLGSLPDSTSTIGLRFNGSRPLGDNYKVGYEGEYAHQTDVADNPNDVDAAYYLLSASVTRSGVEGKIGYEVLEGSTEVGNTNRLTTPLATGFKFNGWADKFLNTPPGGLVDLYFGLNGKIGDKTSFGAIYHDFSADAGGADYGSEIDLIATHKCSDRVSVGLMAANYSADDFATDTLKVWAWLQVSL